jgi:hypothetical protein
MNSDYDDWLYEQTHDKKQDDNGLPLGCGSVFLCLCIYYGCILLFSTIGKML